MVAVRDWNLLNSVIDICIFERTDCKAWQVDRQVKITGKINVAHTALRR
jgi:hypothetical protein